MDIDYEKTLFKTIAGFMWDPVAFVYYNYPWGEKNTSLANEEGPDDWQIEFLDDLALAMLERNNDFLQHKPITSVRFSVRSGNGPGKAHPVGMMIDTPIGLRRWGDLQVGDTLFGRNGKTVKIKAIHPQGIKPIFNVTFDDRTQTQTCGEHLWRVKHCKKGDLVVSTDEILKIGIKNPNGSGKVRSFSIPSCGPVEFPYQWVPVDPYTLGAWLGDGAKNTSTITNMDYEVFDRIRNAGYFLTKSKTKRVSKASIFNISMLKPMLKILDLDQCGSPQRYVPDIYKYNLPKVRAEVLRGLLDTDGCVASYGTAIFSSSSKRLRDDVAWLCRSLGGKALCNNKETTHLTAWTASLTFPDGFKPFYIKRKADRCRLTSQKRYVERFFDKISPAGEAECMCVTVDAEDSLYLANDFIVTHNSCLAAWIISWFMSTRPNAIGRITANTENQLRTTTWRELAKWHDLSQNKHWFTWTGARFYHNKNKGIWCTDAVSWNEDKPEAFSGVHGEHTLYLMDEASGIPDIVCEYAEGAMTDPRAVWLMFGNPTKNTGKFSETFKDGSRWNHRSIDSRSAKRTNKEEIDEWIKEYGEDSDYVRIHVYGKEPRQESRQMIAMSLVEEAWGKELVPSVYQHEPKVIGFDVSVGGQDPCVIRKRQGLNANFLPIRFSGDPDLTVSCNVLARAMDEWKPDAVFVDIIGVGAGVPGIMARMGYTVTGINGKNRAIEQQKYSNRRTENLNKLKLWLLAGGAIDKSKELKADLTTPMVGEDGKGRLQVELKKDVMKRLKRSPDDGDSLSLTFAEEVAVKTDDDFEDWLAKKGMYNPVNSPDSWMAA